MIHGALSRNNHLSFGDNKCVVVLSWNGEAVLMGAVREAIFKQPQSCSVAWAMLKHNSLLYGDFRNKE